MKAIKIRLCLMMFFQYMLFAVWWVPLAAYLTKMGIPGINKSLILSSMAIGCILSPVIGMFADRYFAGQKLLTLLNVMTGIMLICSGISQDPNLLFVFLLVAMLFYMPTWSLVSAIAMKHSNPEIFPQIRVFGSIGWVTSGVFSLFTVHFLNTPFDGTNLPFFFGAGVSFIAALQNLTLPHTPPATTPKSKSLINILGLGTIRLMKDKNFAVFIVLSFLSMIPFSMYWSYCSQFLMEKKVEHISVMMNLGQLAEMFFLMTVPFVIKKVGLRNTIIIGLLFLVVRNGSFYLGVTQNHFWTYFIGVVVHGLIFGYFYLGGQIYTDKMADEALRSQAQGFIFFITFGVGLLAGNFISGQIIELYSQTINDMVVYNWGKIWFITTIQSMVIMLVFVVFFKPKIVKVNN